MLTNCSTRAAALSSAQSMPTSTPRCPSYKHSSCSARSPRWPACSSPSRRSGARPYIAQNIRLTRLAYGLTDVQEEVFPAERELTAADLVRNDLTIKNVRLWDHRPLLATYRQLQQIRTYYDFVDVDNDRYVVNGEYRQVMLSPRELSYKNLPSRIWINEHFTYTHGYGVTLGPVNRISAEGLPEFFIKDIPPV
ncbi:MAG: hypothetical protein E6K64_06260, partial [Nitrospirae bacterium]